jgi:carboxymethylenebutenolidase
MVHHHAARFSGYRVNMAAEIESSTVDVGELRAYLARPAGGSTAGMLLLPMITGIGEQLREYAETLARVGVTALTWDPWHGPSSDDTAQAELARLLGTLDDEKALREQRLLLDHLFGELGCTKTGVIGWCLGGRFALLLAGRDERPASVIAYHPTVPIPPAPNHDLDAAEYAGRITAPVMMLYPGADSLVPVESFQRLQAALNSRTTGASIIHVYPGAEHGFSSKARHGNPVNLGAFTISWPQVLEFVRSTTAG